MAQIADVIRASAVFDAARQELSWAHCGDFTGGVPENLKGAVDMISQVLNEAEIRWVTSTEMMVDEVEDVEKGEDARSIGERDSPSMMGIEGVAYDMRAVAQKELLEDYMIDDKKVVRFLNSIFLYKFNICKGTQPTRSERVNN